MINRIACLYRCVRASDGEIELRPILAGDVPDPDDRFALIIGARPECLKWWTVGTDWELDLTRHE